MLLATLALSLLVVVSPLSASASSSSHKVGFQFGIDSYFVYNCQSQTLIDAWATRQFTDIKALGANTIGLGFPLYTDTLTSNSVYSKLVCSTTSPNNPFQTPTVAALRGVIKIAHSLGLKVFLRPLVDDINLKVQNPKWWRGILAPTDSQLWINNYLGTLRPFLQLAANTHVEHFAVETELDSMSSKSFWPTAIALCKAIYSGDLVWNYGWDMPSGYVKVTRPGTSLGLDTYPKAVATPQATPAQLLVWWNHLLKSRPSYAVPSLSSATIDEVGINAQDGAYAQPEQPNLPLDLYPFDQKIQVNWFATACNFARQHQMKGIYFWGPWLTTKGGALLTAPDPSRAQYIQPDAGQAIAKCFASAWH